MKVDYDRISPEKDPGDYYENKRREADAVRAEMTRHELDECRSIVHCVRCKELERQLERARYVGD
jgi:hypothetical protein